MKMKITNHLAGTLCAAFGIISLAMIPARAAVASYDLTSGGTATINNAIFVTSDNQSTGTGVIDSFVRLQATGSEQGYNADARPVMPDVNTSASFTRDIQLSQVPQVTLGGVAYYEFLLDINQTNANPLLSLNKVQIYTRATALSSAATLGDLTGSSTLRYNLDAGTDNQIQLNYTLNSGSGSGDLFMYVRVSDFGGAPAGSYVYLYSQFGTEDGGAQATYYATNDGFEEWAVRTTTQSTTVADGSTTLSLLGGALIALAALRRQFKAA